MYAFGVRCFCGFRVSTEQQLLSAFRNMSNYFAVLNWPAIGIELFWVKKTIEKFGGFRKNDYLCRRFITVLDIPSAGGRSPTFASFFVYTSSDGHKSFAYAVDAVDDALTLFWAWVLDAVGIV